MLVLEGEMTFDEQNSGDCPACREYEQERQRLMLFVHKVTVSVKDWHPITVRLELLAAIHDLNECGSDDDPR